MRVRAAQANVSCTDAQGGLGQLRINVSRSIRRMWKTSGLFDPSKVSTSSASGWLFLPPPQAALKRSRGYVIAKDDLRIIGLAAPSDQARLLDLFARNHVVHCSQIHPRLASRSSLQPFDDQRRSLANAAAHDSLLILRKNLCAIASCQSNRQASPGPKTMC